MSSPSVRIAIAIACVATSIAGVGAFAAPAKQDEAAKLDDYQVGTDKKRVKADDSVTKVERPKSAVDSGFQMEKPAIEIAPMVVAPMQVAPAPVAAPVVAAPAAAKPPVAAAAKPATTPARTPNPSGSGANVPVAPKPQAVAPSGGALPQAAGGGGEPALVAISTPAPEYPREASMSGLTGYVVVAFTLNVEGVPQDINVIESSPPRVFDQSARRAVARWRFEPVQVNGRPVERKVQRRIDFK